MTAGVTYKRKRLRSKKEYERLQEPLSSRNEDIGELSLIKDKEELNSVKQK